MAIALLFSLSSCQKKVPVLSITGEYRNSFVYQEVYSLPLKMENVADLRITSSLEDSIQISGLDVTFLKSGTYSISVDADSVNYHQRFDVNVSDKDDCTRISYYQLNQRNTYHSLNPIGKQKVLVLPIGIKGYEENEAKVNLDRIKNAFKGNCDYYNVHDFYYESSYGRLDLDFVMPDCWYSCGLNPKEIQSRGDSSYGVVPLMDDALEWFFSTYKEYRRSDFDSDRDGFIDGVFLVYSSPNYTKTDDYEKKYKVMYPGNFWALSSTSLNHQNGDIDNPVSKAYCWASFDFMDEYEKENTTDSHTFIHETGHLLGLPDYYSNYSPNFPVGVPTGGLDMMDNNIGDHNAFSKFAYGWVNPTIIDHSIRIRLSPFVATGDFLLVSSKDYNHTPFDEYFTFEFLTPEKVNQKDSQVGHQKLRFYPECGIRVFHVDSRAKDRIVGGEYTDDLESMKKVAFSNTASETPIYQETGNPMYQLTLIQKDIKDASKCTVLDDRKNYLHELMYESKDPMDALFVKGDNLDMTHGSPYLRVMPSLTNRYDSYRESASETDTFSFTMSVVDINEDYAVLDFTF